jgi:hypothetical protein
MISWYIELDPVGLAAREIIDASSFLNLFCNPHDATLV